MCVSGPRAARRFVMCAETRRLHVSCTARARGSSCLWAGVNDHAGRSVGRSVQSADRSIGRSMELLVYMVVVVAAAITLSARERARAACVWVVGGDGWCSWNSVARRLVQMNIGLH